MDVGLIVAQIVAFLFALSFHEAAHAWTANKLGDTTARDLGRVTMNPIAHIDPFMTLLFPAMLIMAGLPPFGAAKPVPVDTRNLTHPKRDHAWIAAAGPISNVFLAVISILLMRMLLMEMAPFGWLSPAAQEPVFMLLRASIVVNLVLATFNMIPLPPLDGSWILSAALSGRVAAFYRSLQPYGFLILILLMWSGLLWSILRPVVMFGLRLAAF